MEPPVRRLTPRARFALRAGLLIALFVGIGGTVGSCVTLRYYQGPRPAPAEPIAVAPSASTESAAPTGSSSDVAAAPSSSASASTQGRAIEATDQQVAVLSEAAYDVLDRFRSTRLPLTVANLLLSIALVVGVSRTFGRRAGAKAWLRQVCVATALFAAAEHVISRPERAFYEERLRDGYARLGNDPAQVDALVRAAYATKALVAVAQLALFGALAFALGRPSVVLELAPRDPSRGSVPPPSSRDAGDGD
jgi:hypothetical protein